MVNFVSGSEYYINLMNLFYDELIIELNKENISYEYNQFCKNNCINIISHLEEAYLIDINFGKGLSLIVIHGMSSKKYPKWEQCEYGIKNADFFIAPSVDYKKEYIESGVSENKIKLCGNLKIDYLYKLQQSIKMIDDSVCYAPNHNNNTHLLSSYPLFLNDINVLKDKYTVIISPHPYNNNNLPTSDNLCKSKVIISDVGSVSYESMILGKPVVFLDYISKDYIIEEFNDSLESKIFTNNIGYHIDYDYNISNVVDEAFKNGVTENQKIFINELYPTELIGNSAFLITEQIKEMLRW